MTYLRVDLGDAKMGMNDTREFHARFVFLEELYINHMTVAIEVDGGDAQVLYHRACGLRSHPMYLVDTSIFMDKSAYYVDVVYLSYFIDFEQIHEYNWRTVCLDYLYSK